MEEWYYLYKISQKHKEHPSASGIETGKKVFYSSSTSSSMWLFVFVTNSVHSNETITELVYTYKL